MIEGLLYVVLIASVSALSCDALVRLIAWGIGMKESTIQARILKELNTFRSCRAVKAHQCGYGRKGTPDIIGCWHGRPFAIEVKRDGERTERIQDCELDNWRTAGAYVATADSLFDTEKFLRHMATAMH